MFVSFRRPRRSGFAAGEPLVLSRLRFSGAGAVSAKTEKFHTFFHDFCMNCKNKTRT
ncbi:hypothetical protein SUBVAR_07389, partial [Subdoligranulum variabile DSM 15176]